MENIAVWQKRSLKLNLMHHQQPKDRETKADRCSVMNAGMGNKMKALARTEPKFTVTAIIQPPVEHFPLVEDHSQS